MDHPSLQPLDEGFSEDTHSLTGSDTAADLQNTHYDHVKALSYALSDKQRMQLIGHLAASLPIEMLYVLHNDIGSMVYFDPVSYLPDELILHIFSLLSPKDLLTASVVSKPWRERTQDERLWRDNFKCEGWIVDRAKFTEPEDIARRKGVQVAERIMRNDPRPSHTVERRHSRKRARDEAFSESEGTQQEPAGGAGRTEDDWCDNGESMEGVESTDSAEVTNPMTSTDAPKDFDSRPPTPGIDSAIESPTDPNTAMVKFKPTVFSTATEPKVSWPWLYKQRRRLEKNWDTGTFIKFRLPHPDHSEEGHLECVYTIQHSGDHLVSGSRDKTIRVWNLKSQRLRLQPLRGHDASVLCLQFDEKPGEKNDLIVSGGSDNYIMIWRFSTGKLIRKITFAEDGHNESVLNLRFDDRYLVTCSKDKTIKIWNRHDISRKDPIIPARQVIIFDTEIDRGLPIPAFSCLDTLEGHQAAVNAVQIHGDTIVSASGDRTIKSWNIHSDHKGPMHKKSYTGHTKGIACVQFDGRRIVSGSSDNSVRIFDYTTTAEVACLEGHANLVRTVQARFGDLDILTDEDLLDEAKAADQRFLSALNNGMRPAEVSRRRMPRNAGSSRPEDMLSYGTKIPPGGGGSKWAKIVSGSYDETIIIWKKDPGKANKWRPNQRLQQGRTIDQRARGSANHSHAQAQAAQHPHANLLLQQAHGHLTMGTNLLTQPQVGNSHGLPHSQLTALAAVQSTLNQHIQNFASQQHQHAIAHGVTAATTASAAAQTALANLNAQAAQQAAQSANAHGQQTGQQAAQPPAQQQAPPTQQAQAQAQAALPAPHANAAAPANGPAQAHGQGQAQAGQAPAAAQNGQQQAPQAGQAAHHHHHGHGHHHHHHAHGHAQRGESNRVFKLQFDARRIIACSQNRIIVGWDFAAGDKDLEWVGDWSVETP